MSELKFTVETIKELLEAVNKNNIGSLKIKQDDISISIKGSSKEVVLINEVSSSVSTSEAPSSVSVGTSSAPVAPAIAGNCVTSPIVGTFYESSSPDKAPYVKIGDIVKEGDTLFIIESMKLMNEVTCEQGGTVAAIHVENGEPVEYGQPILTIQ